jgi:hypothetical protein
MRRGSQEEEDTKESMDQSPNNNQYSEANGEKKGSEMNEKKVCMYAVSKMRRREEEAWVVGTAMSTIETTASRKFCVRMISWNSQQHI